MTNVNITFADRFNIILSHQALLARSEPKIKKQRISSEEFKTYFIIGQTYIVKDIEGLNLCSLSYISHDLNDKEFQCYDTLIPKDTILLFIGIVKYDFIIKNNTFGEYSIYGLEFLYNEQIVFSVIIYKETDNETIDVFFSEADVKKKLLNSLKENLEICQQTTHV